MRRTPTTPRPARTHRLAVATVELKKHAAVLLEYRGVVHASQAFVRAVERDEPTQWSDQHMRMALAFETTDDRYAWLARSLFIARGRLLGAKAIEYEIYRVV